MIRMACAFLLAAGLAHYLTPMLRQAAIRFGIVDRPDGKLKNHRAPVPYLGGIAVYLSFLLSLALTVEFKREVLGILLAGSIVVILGLIDDLGALSPPVKLAGQVIAILALMKSSVTIKLGFLHPALLLVLSFLWLLSITNAFNLIDIMDGLASGVGLIAALVLACVAAGSGRDEVGTLLAGLAGSLAGFLRYNLEPARIYLGDTGSLFVGLMLGALAMNNSYTSRNLVASVSPVVILGVPIFDMLFVMFIRWRRGIPMMQGSPDHFPLRLRKWRLTTRQTVGASYLAAAVLGGVGIVMMLVDGSTALALLGGTAVVALALGFYLKKIDMTL